MNWQTILDFLSFLVAFFSSLDWASICTQLLTSVLSLTALYASFRLLFAPSYKYQIQQMKKEDNGLLSVVGVILKAVGYCFEGQAPYIAAQRSAGLDGKTYGLSNNFNFLLNITNHEFVEYFSLLKLRIVALHTFSVSSAPRGEALEVQADETKSFLRHAFWNKFFMFIIVVGYLAVGQLTTIDDTVNLFLNAWAVLNFLVSFRASFSQIKVYCGEKISEENMVFLGSKDSAYGQAPYICLQKYGAAEVKKVQPQLVNPAGYLLNIEEEGYPTKINWLRLRQETFGFIRVVEKDPVPTFFDEMKAENASLKTENSNLKERNENLEKDLDDLLSK